MKDSTLTPVTHDDVLFDGEIYWRYTESKRNGNYLISCEKGYNHDLSVIAKMTIIGTFKGNEDKFECD